MIKNKNNNGIGKFFTQELRAAFYRYMTFRADLPKHRRWYWGYINKTDLTPIIEQCEKEISGNRRIHDRLSKLFSPFKSSGKAIKWWGSSGCPGPSTSSLYGYDGPCSSRSSSSRDSLNQVRPFRISDLLNFGVNSHHCGVVGDMLILNTQLILINPDSFILGLCIVFGYLYLLIIRDRVLELVCKIIMSPFSFKRLGFVLLLLLSLYRIYIVTTYIIV
jgi:hypothetical protein